MATPSNKFTMPDGTEIRPNQTLRGDEARNVGDLECIASPDSKVSSWELSEEDVQQILKTKRMYIAVLSDIHPPIALSAKLDDFIEFSDEPTGYQVEGKVSN